MFGIGPTELIVVLVLALIVVGPEKLPSLAGQIGKAIRDFRQMSGDMTGEFQRAFQLDEPLIPTAPVMTDEVIAPSATPNGTGEAFPALAAQVITDEPPIEPPAAIAETTSTDAVTTYSAPVESLVATKADPLAGASFLDEPEPAPEPAPEAETTTHVGMAVATFSPPPMSGDEHIAAANPVADAWDAVLTTDATLSLPEPATDELLSVTTVGTAVALAEPEPETSATTSDAQMAAQPTFADPAPRPPVDPNAEVTIREIIEGQVAAEAFRERRRVAKYQRHK
jgi:Tat protein translocase TatB subunit